MYPETPFNPFDNDPRGVDAGWEGSELYPDVTDYMSTTGLPLWAFDNEESFKYFFGPEADYKNDFCANAVIPTDLFTTRAHSKESGFSSLESYAAVDLFDPFLTFLTRKPVMWNKGSGSFVFSTE